MHFRLDTEWTLKETTLEDLLALDLRATSAASNQLSGPAL